MEHYLGPDDFRRFTRCPFMMPISVKHRLVVPGRRPPAATAPVSGLFAAGRLGVRLPLLVSGAAAFYAGVLLASLNGYTLGLFQGVVGSLALLLLQAVLLSRPGIAAELAACLMGGFFPVLLGFFWASGHWGSELFLVGLLFTFASLLTSLSVDLLDVAVPSLGARLGPVKTALLYTGVNILVIAGLLFSLFFPAVPYPYHQILWIAIGFAVLNQELVKRRFYRQPHTHLILWRLTAANHLFLAAAWLFITWERL